MERFRNLSYLESELARYHNAEVEKKAESDRLLKRMQQRCFHPSSLIHLIHTHLMS
jgi:hypothetical protein